MLWGYNVDYRFIRAPETNYANRHINGKHFATNESEGSDAVVVKELSVTPEVFDAFLEGLSRDLELSVLNLEEMAFKTGAPDSVIAVAAREASSAQEVVLKRLSNCRHKMKPFLFSRLPSGERPPFKKVRSFVRQTTPGSDKPGPRHESSEFTLLIEDKEMKNTVTLALDKLQQNRRAEEANTRGGRDWSMRQVTPTWVDGRKLDPGSNAWTHLVSATVTATLGQSQSHLRDMQPPKAAAG